MGPLHGVIRERISVDAESLESGYPWLLILQDPVTHALQIIMGMPDSWMLELARSGLRVLDSVEVRWRDWTIKARHI